MAVTDGGQLACKKRATLRWLTRLASQKHSGWERQMTNFLNVAIHRPMVRLSIQVIVAFCCAAPVVLLFSSVVAYGVNALVH
jgi:hypothetical protein